MNTSQHAKLATSSSTIQYLASNRLASHQSRDRNILVRSLARLVGARETPAVRLSLHINSNRVLWPRSDRNSFNAWKGLACVTI